MFKVIKKLGTINYKPASVPLENHFTLSIEQSPSKSKKKDTMSNNVIVYSNSQSTIYLCKNPMFHKSTKHIDFRVHFIRDVVS